MAGICIGLFLLVLCTFWPSLGNGFVNYDDDLYVAANGHVQSGLSWAGARWAFCTPVAANWHPATILSHMLDCQLFGLKPWGHHLTSVWLHAVNTVLVFLVFRRMTGALWRSLLVAALFGLHPLRVESVAWVAERKDVLSTFFFMLTLWAYVRYAQESKVQSPKSKVAYVLALVFFACGLMSKPMLVTLPFVLLLLDYWPLGRNAECGMRNAEPGAGGKVQGRTWPWMKLVREKAPFFLLAAIASAVTLITQHRAKALATVENIRLIDRLANALVSYCRYLAKFLWPAKLAVFYPEPVKWPTATVLLAGLLLLGISIMAVALRHRHRYLPVGWLWSLGTLVPVIGLVQVGAQAMADRYTYVPLIGVALLLVWGMHELTSRWQFRAVLLSAAAAAGMILCVALTRRQIGHWRDTETLFRHALAVTDDNWVAHHNLGDALEKRGRLDEAIHMLRKR